MLESGPQKSHTSVPEGSQSAGFGRDLRGLRLRLVEALSIARAKGTLLVRPALLENVPPPVFIGGTGGSGTRVIARFAEEAGAYMGHSLRNAYDAQVMGRFLRAWIGRWLAPGGLSPAERSRMRRDFDMAVIRHRQGLVDPERTWGAKNPRSMYLLRFFEDRFPRFRFVHLVRDGRDMAFSSRQNQLEAYGKILLDERLQQAELPLRSIALWSRANCEAHTFGCQILRERYLLIRFEDLCAAPVATLQHIASFLRLSSAAVDEGARFVHAPQSLGRWVGTDPAVLADLHREGQPGLVRFRYLER